MVSYDWVTIICISVKAENRKHDGKWKKAVESGYAV